MTHEKDKVKNFITTAGMIIGMASAIASPFIAIGVADAKLQRSLEAASENSDSIKMLWQNISADRSLLAKHEAIIPTLRDSIVRIENGQDKMSDKIDRLLLATKA